MTPLLVISFLLSLPAFSQTGNPSASPQMISVDRFCGLDTSDPANTIQDCNCQDCLNVESSIRGDSLTKRRGFEQLNTLTIATSPATGNIFYYDTSGNQNVIVCQDLNCELSQNNTAFTTILSTASPTPKYWSLVAANGIAYGANDKQDKVFVYSNGSLTYSNTIPQCKLLDLTQDRMVCANTSANPNSVNYSKSGDFTTWTTGVNSVDPFADNIGNPGQQITGLINWLGNEYIFTDQSITSCQLGDQYTTTCGIVSNKIGTLDPLSLILTPNGIMFHGSDDNFWLYDGLNLVNKTLVINSLLMSTANGKNFSNTQTTKGDWDAGSQSPSGSWSTLSVPGSVLDSSITFNDSSSTSSYANFTLLYTSTQDVTSGVLSLLRSTYTTTNGNLTNGNSSGWVLYGSGSYQAGQFSATSCGGSDSPASDYLGTNLSLSAGNYIGTLSAYAQGGTLIKSCAVTFNTNGLACSYVSDTCDVSIASGTALSGTGAGRQVELNITNPQQYPGMYVGISYPNWSATSSTAPAANQVSASLSCTSGLQLTALLGKTCLNTNYMPSGTATSINYNTSYISPVYGTFNVGMSTNSNTAITFKTQTSVDGISFDAGVSVANGAKITSASKQYIKWVGTFTNTLALSSGTPTITSDSLLTATTGFFETQCINTTGISSFSEINCATSNMGAGSVTFAVSTGTTCGTIPSITDPNRWTAQTNNSNISVGIGNATAIRFQSLLGSATDQAQVDACTINWVSGSPAPNVFGMYDPQNNSAYWAFSVNQSTYNTRVLKYDMNLDALYPFGLYANSMLFYNNSIFFGGSNGGYWNELGMTDNDNGQAINAFFKTKDFNCREPFNEAIWQNFSFVTKNEPSGSLTNTWTLDRGTTGNYSVSISTTSTIPYVRSNKLLPLDSPATYANFNIGNNAANQPFEIMGFQIGCYSKPWRPLTP